MTKGDKKKKLNYKELEDRVRELETLRESEEKYRCLFEQAGDAILIVDPETSRFLDCNEKATRYLGYNRDQLLQMKLADIHPPESAAQNQSIMKELLEKGALDFERIQLHKDGKLIPVEVICRVISYGNKKVLEGIVRDIIERKKTQEMLAHELEVNEALSALYEPLITASTDEGDIAKIILTKALALTGSSHGYVSSIDPETKNNVSHTLTEMLKEECKTEGKNRKIIFPINENGQYNSLWGYALNTREPFFTNAPSRHPAATGVPAGHIPLQRFLSVPVLLGQELVGHIALANKDGDYNALDLEATGRLARFYALAIQHFRTEKALLESELRFRSTFEQAAVGIAHAALNGRCLRINQRFCDIVGYSREEMLTRTFQDITHPDDLETDSANFRQMLANEIDTFSLEKRYIRKDNSIVWSNMTVALMRNSAGEPQFFIAVAENITNRKQIEEELQKAHDELEQRVRERTAELVAANIQLKQEIEERKQAETELKEREAQYKRLLEGIPGILYLYSDRRGGIFYSPQVESILGYPPARFYEYPQLWYSSIHPDDREKMDNAFKEFLEGKEFDLQYRVKDSAGQWRWFSDRSIGKRQGQKEIILEGLALDITDRKKAEQEQEQLENQLREAQKLEAIGTLAGGIAHDFNNILAAIIGYSELALSRIPTDSKAVTDMNEVLKAGNRAKELIKQILAFSRQGSRELKPLQIQLVIKEAIKLLEATLPRTIQIVLEIDPKCGMVMADPTQIHQVMMNLCTNAYHAMRVDGGILGISLTPADIGPGELIRDAAMEPGPYVKLTVSDTGHGMNRSVIERIFDPYFTTKAKGEGTGLGLSVVHGIIKTHKGQITVYSEPGKGTTFQVYLPCCDAGTGANETISTGPVPRGHEHILFLDDEEPLAFMSKEMLQLLGYRVTAVTDSQEALNLFQTQPHHYDMVVTDMTMPHMTGTQLARKLLEIRPGIPVILCTGFSDMVNEKHARELGFREYITKPILLKELAITIRRVLDEKPKPLSQDIETRQD